MRFISLLLTVDEENEFTNDNTPHIYSKELRDKYLSLSTLFDTENIDNKKYNLIKYITHPFDLIKTYITSSFIPDKELKITNAYMKMYEFLLFITDQDCILNKTKLTMKELTMFDVAGAPGMFVLAAEQFYKQYNITIDWYTCSLEGGTALTDSYELYKNNIDRYTPCDVTKEEDLLKIINLHKKYKLITGDIGIFHDDDWYSLQEEKQLDIEYGQMILALNLVDEHGIMFLKMYSLITYESIYLLDTLTKYFRSVYVCKPYTSRILNSECYIICIDKNNKEVNEPLLKPNINIPYNSPNIDIITSFESSRLDIKTQMMSFSLRLINNYKIKYVDMNKLKNNKLYKGYFNDFVELYDLFES